MSSLYIIYTVVDYICILEGGPCFLFVLLNLAPIPSTVKGLYSINRVPECLSLRRNWSPHPFPRKRVCLVVYPLGYKGGEQHSLAGERVGGTRIRRLDRKLGPLYTLRPLPSAIIFIQVCLPAIYVAGTRL
jgi:hypothetical protein